MNIRSDVYTKINENGLLGLYTFLCGNYAIKVKTAFNLFIEIEGYYI